MRTPSRKQIQVMALLNRQGARLETKVRPTANTYRVVVPTGAGTGWGPGEALADDLKVEGIRAAVHPGWLAVPVGTLQRALHVANMLRRVWISRQLGKGQATFIHILSRKG